MVRVMPYLLLIMGMLMAIAFSEDSEMFVITFIDFDVHKEKIGNNKWQITGKWKLPINETLKEVKLESNNNTLLIYKPGEQERQHQEYRNDEYSLIFQCKLQGPTKMEGTCVATLEQQQCKYFPFAFEVSGHQLSMSRIEDTVGICCYNRALCDYLKINE